MTRLRSALRLTRRLRADRKGNVAIIFAFAAPLVIGGAGLGVETTYWYYKDLKLQSAADAAAYAAAIELRSGHDSLVNSTALSAAASNGFAPAGTIQVNTPPTSGPNAGGSAVEVILTEPEQRFFTALFSGSQVKARARSVAILQTASGACVLALDPQASGAAYFSGSANVRLNGCSVMSDSIASDSITVQGASLLNTACAIAVGGVSNSGGLTMSQCSTPVTQAPPMADPYRNVPAPSTTGPCLNGNGKNLSAGHYCGGLDLKNTVNFGPGVYVIDGGTFKINAGANVSGSGVIFYLTGNTTIQFNGNAVINLSPPTSGTYSGMLFFADRNNPGLIQKLNGDATSHLTGALYFPTQAVQYLGNFGGANGCTQVIGDTVYWSGNTTFNMDCSAYGMHNMPASQLVKLAE